MKELKHDSFSLLAKGSADDNDVDDDDNKLL
jgi:hypothetical protein